MVAGLDPAQRVRVVGRSNLALVESGTVAWSDVVSRTAIRPLAEVVARERLSLDALVGAGVPRPQAVRAWAEANAPGRLATAAAQARLVERLRAAGLTADEVRREVASRLAARVGIAGGPSGPGTISPPPPPPAVPVPPRPRPVWPAAVAAHPAFIPGDSVTLDVPGLGPVAFARSPGDRANRRQAVMVDVAAFDASLAAGPAYHVGPAGTGPSAVAGRYAEFLVFLRRAAAAGTPIEMPRAGVDADGHAFLIDGRHRFAVLRDLGLDRIPVAAGRGAPARRLAERFGVARAVAGGLSAAAAVARRLMVAAPPGG